MLGNNIDIDTYRQQQQMMGLEAIPEYDGGDPQEYLTNLYFTGHTDLARQWAEQSGIDPKVFNEHVGRVNEESQARRGANVFGQIGGLTRVGRGEVTGAADFARDAAALGAIGYGTTFLGSSAAPATAAPSVPGASSGAWLPGGMGGAPASAGSGGALTAAGNPIVGASASAWAPGQMGGASANAGSGGGFFSKLLGQFQNMGGGMSGGGGMGGGEQTGDPNQAQMMQMVAELLKRQRRPAPLPTTPQVLAGRMSAY